jgi:hypothetical protein
MSVPVTASDSYATPMNAPLTVAAPGVLGNDTGTGLSAVLVADSAEHGTVVLNSTGGFTFTPASNFVGTASFRYTARTAELEESADTTVYVEVGDCVQWAHLTSSAEGQRTVQGDGRGSTVWSVRADTRNRTAHEILASPKLPQRGEPLRRYTLGGSGAYTITRTHVPDGDPVSEHVVVVLTEARQEAGNPWLWTVTVRYEGKDDPTAELPDVSTSETEYQDYLTADLTGRVYANSALDPIEGGIPVDAAWDQLTLTRNLPYDAWNTDRKRGYRNTLNIRPFRLGNQVGENGDPVDLPVGLVRLKRITEQRMVRADGGSVAASKFYWRVTAELLIDGRTFRPRPGDPPQPARHRHLVSDAGYNTLTAGVKRAILLPDHSRPTQPQLLNGAGGLVANPTNAWPTLPPQPALAPGKAVAVHDYFSTPADTALTKSAAEGVLANDLAGGPGPLTAHLVSGSATGGTVSLAADGSFTFTPTSGFVGYATFRYTARIDGNPITGSPEGWVVVFVGAAPVLTAWERYHYADWSPLAALLEGW